MTSQTARVRAVYDRVAPDYDRTIGWFERLLFGDGRQWVCSQAEGDVLEVAVGTGRNFPYYPADVGLAGIDLSPAMLAIAERRALALGRTVNLHVGDAQALTFPDATFNTVVVTLGLCSIPDDQQAIGELRRVLRPRGRLLWLEHVRSPLLPVRSVQRLLEPLARRHDEDHLLREPLDWLGAAGFEVVRVERSKWGLVERGVARKPDE
jgi:ubiquinone/menaquinone biosynthesis C-methylase UbiE